MKKLILILTAAAGLLLVGCNQGGTSDQYNTSNAGGRSSNSPSQNHGNANSNSTPIP
jgi:hypothetical protein